MKSGALGIAFVVDSSLALAEPHVVPLQLELKGRPTAQLTKLVAGLCLEAVADYCRVVFDLVDVLRVRVRAFVHGGTGPVESANDWTIAGQCIASLMSRFPLLAAGLPDTPEEASASPRESVREAVRSLYEGSADGWRAGRRRAVVLLAQGSEPPPESFGTEAIVQHAAEAAAAAAAGGEPPGRIELLLIRVLSGAASAPDAGPVLRPRPVPSPHAWLRARECSVAAGDVAQALSEAAEEHLVLRRVRIRGIPMKDGGAYDVVVLHAADGHAAPPLRAAAETPEARPAPPAVLQWKPAPKGIEMSAFRVRCLHRATPACPTDSATVSLVKFLAGGKAACLTSVERAAERGAATLPATHALYMHGAAMHLHCLHGPQETSPLSFAPAAGGPVAVPPALRAASNDDADRFARAVAAMSWGDLAAGGEEPTPMAVD